MSSELIATGLSPLTLGLSACAGIGQNLNQTPVEAKKAQIELPEPRTKFSQTLLQRGAIRRPLPFSNVARSLKDQV